MGGRDHTTGVKVWHNMSNSEKADVMCDRCRAVTVLCTTYKIVVNIAYVKLVTYSEEIIGEYQGGF